MLKRKFLCLVAAGFIWNANAVQGRSALSQKAPEVCAYFGGVLNEIDLRVPHCYEIESLEDLFSSFIVKLNAHAAEFDGQLLNNISMWFNGPTMLALQNKTDNMAVVDAFLGAIIRASNFLTNDFDDIKNYALKLKERLKNRNDQTSPYALTGSITEAKKILGIQ